MTPKSDGPGRGYRSDTPSGYSEISWDLLLKYTCIRRALWGLIGRDTKVEEDVAWARKWIIIDRTSDVSRGKTLLMRRVD